MPRGPKTSDFVGVKKRGGCNSVDMRLRIRERWEVGGFPNATAAALAHDILRLLDLGVPRYTSYKAEKLNFSQYREFLIWFSKEYGMEKFRVVAKEEEKSWGADKKKAFMLLVEDALRQINSLNTVRAEDSEADAEATGAQQSGTSSIRINDEENKDWDIGNAFPSDNSSLYTFFRSRESERAIHSRVVELQANLSEEKEKRLVLEANLSKEKEKNLLFEMLNTRQHAEIERLKQGLAAGAEADQHEQNISDAPVDGQAQSKDAGGTILEDDLSDIFRSLPDLPGSEYLDLEN